MKRGSWLEPCPVRNHHSFSTLNGHASSFARTVVRADSRRAHRLSFIEEEFDMETVNASGTRRVPCNKGS